MTDLAAHVLEPTAATPSTENFDGAAESRCPRGLGPVDFIAVLEADPAVRPRVTAAVAGRPNKIGSVSVFVSVERRSFRAGSDLRRCGQRLRR